MSFLTTVPSQYFTVVSFWAIVASHACWVVVTSHAWFFVAVLGVVSRCAAMIAPLVGSSLHRISGSEVCLCCFRRFSVSAWFLSSSITEALNDAKVVLGIPLTIRAMILKIFGKMPSTWLLKIVSEIASSVLLSSLGFELVSWRNYRWILLGGL